MNTISQNNVGSIKKIYNKLPIFMLALLFSTGIFVTSCSDPLTPVEETLPVVVEDKLENEFDKIEVLYNLVSFGVLDQNQKYVNFNQNIKFNKYGKYQFQVKEQQSQKWVNLDFEIEDNNIVYLKPNLKFHNIEDKFDKRFLTIKNWNLFFLLEGVNKSDFLNKDNKFEFRIIESISKENFSKNSGSILRDLNDVIEVEQFTNIKECKNKIRETEFK